MAVDLLRIGMRSNKFRKRIKKVLYLHILWNGVDNVSKELEQHNNVLTLAPIDVYLLGHFLFYYHGTKKIYLFNEKYQRWSVQDW